MNTPAIKKLIVFVAVLTAGSPAAFGSNVALRAKSHHQGSMIRLGDIADISAASTSEVRNLGTTVLLPAPAPGTQHFLTRSQIRDLLTARGVDLGAIYFSGADVVEVGTATLQAEEVDQEPLAPQLTKEAVESLLQDSIRQRLARQTGHTQWRVTTLLKAAAYQRVAKLGTTLTVSGGRKPWTGRQFFLVADDLGEQGVTVAATVYKIQPVVTAVRTIERGELIRASDIEIRQHEGSLSGAAVSKLANAIGMEARSTIKADSTVLEIQLKAPLLVERGETVTVFARTAGIAVRTFAVARQDGARDELVQVETVDDKQRFTARVSGRRQLEVLATGATTGDFATLPRHEPVRR